MGGGGGKGKSAGCKSWLIELKRFDFVVTMF